jgi:hypothetical protein
VRRMQRVQRVQRLREAGDLAHCTVSGSLAVRKGASDVCPSLPSCHLAVAVSSRLPTPDPVRMTHCSQCAVAP